MKWNKPKVGQERTRTFFAWLPVEIDSEVRWLETVTVRDLYRNYTDRLVWKKVQFVDAADDRET